MSTDAIRAELEKRFKKDKETVVGTIENHFATISKYLDTGIPELNWAISGCANKGIPYGRIISFDGSEQSGKTAMGYYLLGQALKQGAVPILIETESASDPDFAAKNSLDPKETIVIGLQEKPTLDRVFGVIAETINTANEKGSPAVVVLDSLPACLSSNDDVAKGYDGTRAAQKIRSLMSRLLGAVASNEFLLIIINHLIQDPSSMSNALIPRGGTGFRHYLSARITLNIREYLKKNRLDQSEYPYGVIIEGKVEKTRFCSPKRKAKIQITFERGVDPIMSMFNQLKRADIIQVKGSWHEYNEKKFRVDDFYDMFNTDPTLKEMAYALYTKESDETAATQEETD